MESDWNTRSFGQQRSSRACRNMEWMRERSRSGEAGVARAEIAIVGAGAIGIELAVALKRLGVDYVQFDSGQIGSTIEWYAPQTHFFSSPERIAIAGVPLQTLDQTKATREEYLTYLRAVVQQFDLSIETFRQVTGIEKMPDGRFQLTTVKNGQRRLWHSTNVILAIGDMHRPRLLGIRGENLPHVSHYFRDPHHYFRRKTFIVGGKNSAVEAAIRCHRAGAEVTLSYRGAELDPAHVKFWLLPELRSLLRDGNVRFLSSTIVSEITAEDVLLQPAGGGETFRVTADAVLLLTGYEQDPTLFEQTGVTLVGEGRKPKHDENTMETDVRGVYVAGTAAAGTQLAGVKAFIETSHVHVDRIVHALTGRDSGLPQRPVFEIPET